MRASRELAERWQGMRYADLERRTIGEAAVVKLAEALKTNTALGKLELFRGFYVTVVAFIYFTRIVVYLVKRTAPYESVWVAEALREGATLLFYATVGLKFRPVADNPYTQVEEEELRVMETW